MKTHSAPYADDLPALRGIQGIAVLAVIVASFLNTPLGAQVFAHHLALGGFGIEVLFIVAGFVLTHRYGDALQKGGFELKGFWLRRLARVWPLHMAVLLVYGLLVGVIPAWSGAAANTAEGFLNQAFLMASWTGAEHSFTPVGWVVSGYAVCLALFPFLLMRQPKRRLAVFTGVAVLVMGLVGAMIAPTGFQNLHLVGYGLLRLVPCFMLGILLYRVWRDVPLGALGRFSMAWGATGLAVAVALGAPGWLMLVAASGWVVWAADLSRDRHANWLQRPGLQTLGHSAYGIFLCAPLIADLSYTALVGSAQHVTLPVGLIYGHAAFVMVAAIVVGIGLRQGVQIPAAQAIDQLWQRYRMARPKSDLVPQTEI